LAALGIVNFLTSAVLWQRREASRALQLVALYLVVDGIALVAIAGILFVVTR
jgi:hypothetical protein